jgi:hypothetical protein
MLLLYRHQEKIIVKCQLGHLMKSNLFISVESPKMSERWKITVNG